MNSRQRLLTALSHRQPDRCPTYIWINHDAMMNVVEYLGAKSVRGAEEILKIDRWQRVRPVVTRPEDYSARIDALVPSEYRSSPEFHVTPLGRVVRVHEGAAYMEDAVWYPLQNAASDADLDAYPFPQPDWISVPDELVSAIQAYKEADRFVYGDINQVFSLAWQLRGMNNVLADFLINPQLIGEVYDRLYSYVASFFGQLVRAGVDMVQLIGDVGMQNSLMMSPAVWREFDKGRIEKLIKELKGINPDLIIYMHTDGNVSEIIEDLIEVGIDVLNPIQPECMDPVQIKREYGNRLVLHGAVSMQRTLPLGSPEDVKQEVRYLIENCNVNGGFVLGPSNVIFKEIPPENVVAMYEAVQ